MSEPIVSIRNAVKTFRAGGAMGGKKKVVHAVNDVSFDIMPGETFSLVGESGCGKSTTGRLINCLIRPDSGQVVFDGTDVSKLSEKEMRPLRANVQMIFQDPYGSLNPRIKIQDLIGEPLLLHPASRVRDEISEPLKNLTNLSAGERLQRVHELLKLVGLSPSHGERYPHEFSGGQLQRVGIARAISVNPKLIIADEPVSALDVSIQAQVLNLMNELQEKMNLTYLFISHDLSVVEMISDRIAVMYLGTIVEIADKRDLYAMPAHPYTQALLSAVPIPDPTVKKERILLAGDIPSPVNPPSGCLFHTRCPYCTDECKTKKPDMKDFGNGHKVKCHYAEKFIGKKAEAAPV